MPVFGIVNVVGSPIARAADCVIYTKANKEIAVASTKAYMGQVVRAVPFGPAVGAGQVR